MVGPARRARPRARAAGFTLIELVVVIALLAILASLAAPAMQRMLATQRVKSTASNLHLALMKARSEAIKRNDLVTVRPTTGTDWSTGWNILFGAATLDVTQAQTRVVVTATPSPTAAVTYRADGRLTSAPVMFVTSSNGSTVSRCVSIDAAGRPYNKEGTAC